MNLKHFWIACVCALVAGCTQTKEQAVTFQSDVDFLKANTPIIVLKDDAGAAQVAVSPAWQGRVMTSTAAGGQGVSFGWINREVIAAKKVQEHINVFGGEDRFWMGPEGGPFSIYFAKGKEQVFANWFTPACIDTEPFDVVSQSADKAVFRRAVKLTNASGTTLDVRVDRTVQLVSDAQIRHWGVELPAGVKRVCYESQNTITNTGKAAWDRKSGMLSIWILGMYNPSPTTTIVVPFKKDGSGTIVNRDYFGPVPDERLKIDAKAGVIYFSADGTYRSKIGLPPGRSTALAGSYDAATRTLTLVQYNMPKDMSKVAYVNSQWGEQKDPFAGDVVNSYNDGPPSPGAKPLGPFYELETSSPAAALAPGESLTHVHRTFHIQGDEAALDSIARKTLGVGLAEIQGAFRK